MVSQTNRTRTTPSRPTSRSIRTTPRRASGNDDGDGETDDRTATRRACRFVCDILVFLRALSLSWGRISRYWSTVSSGGGGDSDGEGGMPARFISGSVLRGTRNRRISQLWIAESYRYDCLGARIASMKSPVVVWSRGIVSAAVVWISGISTQCKQARIDRAARMDDVLPHDDSIPGDINR